MNSTSQRAELRNTLLANGYRPLPLRDKGIFIKGWVKADITPDWLARFERSGTYGNTGIRCDNLLAFDIDVLDEALADKIEALIEKRLGPTPLCRYGRFPKRLLLYRLAEGCDAPRSGRTARFVDSGGDIACVELLCSRGRQFAAFGQHPSGVEYEWADDVSPLTVPWADVPGIEPQKALQALTACEKAIRRAGLPERLPGLQHELGGGTDNDLVPDTPVQLSDGTETTWGELRGTLDKEGVFGNLVREDGHFGDSNAVHFMLAAGSGEPCAHDFVRDVTHYESLAAPEVAHLLPDDPNSIATDPHSIFTSNEVEALIENWVIMSDQTTRPLDAPTVSLPLQGFIRNRKHLTVPHPNPPRNQPNKRIPICELWENSPLTKRADTAELRPDRPDRSIIQDGSLAVFNTYRPPVHEWRGGEVDTFLEFIDHLLPRGFEADLFLDWLATKYANPAIRMHAVVMVAPFVFGAGRGTLAQIISKLFGEQYVNTAKLDELIGHGSQSQFNEYMAQSLFVVVEEALQEDENRTKWRSRHLAYEQLKTLAAPESARMQIKRKYGRNSVERVFASLFIQSNHADALAIEPGDRRVIVLSNGDVALIDAPDNLFDRIHAWKDDAANIGALGRWLAEQSSDVRYDPFGKPPMTPAKEAMIEAAQSDTERLFEIFQAEAAGDIVTAAQWRQFAHSARLKYELDLPSDADKLEKALTAVLQKHGRRPQLDNKSGALKVAGRAVRPWIIRNFDVWGGPDADAAGLRQEVEKNGDPGGSIAEFKPRK